MATVLDVAKRAGVSPSTVSRVLNGKPYVRAEVKTRVLEAASELNYKANELARSMRRGYSKAIGLVVRDMLSANFGKICAAAEAEAGLHGFELLICNSNRNPEKERAYIQSLVEWQVDGVIVFAADITVDNIKDLRLNVPIVAASSVTKHEPVDAIDSDWIPATEDATRRLLGLGHTRIGILVWGQYQAGGRSGLEGYLKALEGAGVELDPGLIRHCSHDPDSSSQATIELLGLRSPPTALVVLSPDLTPGALSAIGDAGLSIPTDMSIINIDDSVYAQYHRPPISVMQRDVGLLGSGSVRMLLERLDGEAPGRSRTEVVPFSFNDRGSTAKALSE